MNIKIAMIQLSVAYSQPELNFQRAEQRIRQAKEEGAELALLPECFDLGWANPDAEKLAQPIPGIYTERLQKLAAELGLYICAGLTERQEVPEIRLYNTAVLIDDRGTLLGCHRKINTLVDVEPMYATGRSLEVFETPLGRIGIAICADNAPHSTVLAEALCRMGAQIILSPSAWAVAPNTQAAYYGRMWYDAYEYIARLYHVPMAAVSNVGHVSSGIWQGWSCIGNSIALFGDGVSGTTLPYGEDAETMRILEVPLCMDELRGTSLSDAAEQRKKKIAQ